VLRLMKLSAPGPPAMTSSSNTAAGYPVITRYAVTRCAVRAGDDDRARSSEGVRNVQRATALGGNWPPSRSPSRSARRVILREGIARGVISADRRIELEQEECPRCC
jgi:hypothetical protein